MLIGIDAGCLGLKNSKDAGGIYNVVRVLLKSLEKLDKKNKYLLYSFYPIDRKLMKEFGKSMTNVVVVPTKGWMSIALPIRLNKDKPDVFIGMSQAIPRRLPFLYYPKTISFVYDIAFEKFPKMYRGFPRKLKSNSKRTVKGSDILITTSQNSKKDLVSLYMLKQTRVKVLYPNTAEIYSQKGNKFKNKYPYFLFVGAFKPTKNIPKIIKAFVEFSKDTKFSHELILAGGVSEEIRELSRKNKVKIKTVGFVGEDLLASLYRGATAFISPSFYEGFGMTFLEAMKCGCPIITSDAGSITEIVGDSAIIVDPKKHDEISMAMKKIATDKKQRSKMIKKGFKRARDFSSEKFGREFLKVLNSI